MATTSGDRSAPHAADTHDVIRVQGARENNLKDVSVEIPKRRLTVFTGVSGSGKSSLVFGTIAAESQRMINETYSAFVQGFMPTLARPDVDVLEGLTTAIIVDQERMGANPRSTVGTATDANAMLRILFSRIGTPHIGPPTAFAFNVPTRGRERGDEDREGRPGGEDRRPRRGLPGRHVPAVRGHGRGQRLRPHRDLRRDQVAVRGCAARPGLQHGRLVRPHLRRRRPADGQAGRKFTAKELDKLLYGEPTKIKVEGVNLTYEGVLTKVQKSMLSKDLEAMQPHVRRFVERAVTFTTCPDCEGTRLSKEALVLEDPRQEHRRALRDADQRPGCVGCATSTSHPVAPLLAGLQHLLDSFAEIGLGYLSLDRPAGTLSGGEAQRTKMIRHLGSSLTDVTYVFDEPTIGLHPHDIARMNQLLVQLRDKGNTVLVVEHKPETIAIADHVVDLGPGAGTGGGSVCFEGTVEGLRASDTTTGHHLDDRVALKDSVRAATCVLEVRGASTHNLRDVDVDIPLGVLCVAHRGRRVRARARWSRARSPGATASWSSTRARSAARGAATPRPTPDCSNRSARRSRRPTA